MLCELGTRETYGWMVTTENGDGQQDRNGVEKKVVLVPVEEPIPAHSHLDDTVYASDENKYRADHGSQRKFDQAWRPPIACAGLKSIQHLFV